MEPFPIMPDNEPLTKKINGRHLYRTCARSMMLVSIPVLACGQEHSTDTYLSALITNEINIVK